MVYNISIGFKAERIEKLEHDASCLSQAFD